MAYYHAIAKQWHEATGYKGGAFKELVLNNILLEKIPAIHNRSILELGTGNGYFLPLVMRRFSGQQPSGIMITDVSEKLLKIAQQHFRTSNAAYECLDVCKPFSFSNNSFDIIIASMIFNELPPYCFINAVNECYRVLTANGVLLIAVIHPSFVQSLQKREQLKAIKNGPLTMPGSGTLRLPVVPRTLETYQSVLQEAGFHMKKQKQVHQKKFYRLKRVYAMPATFLLR
jgi:ubiquinone/menaquinone biosynthesis C-methylase UbiE